MTLCKNGVPDSALVAAISCCVEDRNRWSCSCWPFTGRSVVGLPGLFRVQWMGYYWRGFPDSDGFSRLAQWLVSGVGSLSPVVWLAGTMVGLGGSVGWRFLCVSAPPLPPPPPPSPTPSPRTHTLGLAQQVSSNVSLVGWTGSVVGSAGSVVGFFGSFLVA